MMKRSSMVPGRLWITWERQRRSVELSKYFGCELVEILDHGLLRYFRSTFRTLKLLFAYRKGIVFVQNPSMILATVATVFGSVFGTPIVVDRHTTFLLGKQNLHTPRLTIFRMLSRFTLRFADLTIVTNAFLASLVEAAGGRAFVLPDRLPAIGRKRQQNGDSSSDKRYSFLFISSFASDEPIEDVIAAVIASPEPKPRVYISGNTARAPKHLLEMGENVVTFTGFLPDDEYYKLLVEVDAVLALTTSDYTMLCGCYETVAAEQVLITSDKQVLQEYFSEAVFVDNTPESIAESFIISREQSDQLLERVVMMKRRLEGTWSMLAENLENEVRRLEEHHAK